MNVQNIINKARRLAFVDDTQYLNTDGLSDLNEVYFDLITTIINKVGENYFYDIYTDNLNINQNEYIFKIPTSTVTGMNKIKELYIKYSDTGDFVKVRSISESSLENTPDYYKINQSEQTPFFYIADNSIFIFPEPKNNVTGGIKASVSIIPPDLLLTDEEIGIKIQRQHHKVLVYGLLPYIFTQRGMFNESINANNQYENLKNDLVLKLGERDLSPCETYLPNLGYYE